MKFTLVIETRDDALIGADAHIDVIRIVREVADRLEHRQREGRCRDACGNAIGEWRLEAGA